MSKHYIKYFKNKNEDYDGQVYSISGYESGGTEVNCLMSAPYCVEEDIGSDAILFFLSANMLTEITKEEYIDACIENYRLLLE